MKNRKLLLIVSLVLALTMSLGGTLAYLTDTDEAVNVMTLGNVDIEQYEKDAEGNTFEQNQPLYPAYYTTDNEGNITSAVTGAIDKVVSVKNVGTSEAYVRTLLAFEAGNLNYADFQKYIHTEFEMQAEWLQTPINVKGVNYYVACVDYDKLAAGFEGDASLLKVYMDKTATNETVAQFGDTYEIIALSQAIQTNNMPDAEAAWLESFGAFNAENAAKWFNGVSVIPVTTVSTADELKEALAQGGTIMVTEDIKVTETLNVASGTNVEIILNGADINYGVDNNGKAAAIINNKGNLTISGNGTLSFVAADPDMAAIPGYATNTITNTGVLTIEEGVTVENGSEGGASYAVDVQGGTFYLNGGTLKGERCALRIAKFNQDNVVFVMNGGLVEGATPAWIHLPGSTASAAPTITVTINDGTFKSTKASSADNDVLYTYSFGNSHANTTVTINGGNFLGGTVSIGSGYKGDAPALTINGGTFEYPVLQWLENDECDTLTSGNLDYVAVVTAADLVAIANADKTEYKNATIKLMADIDLAGIEWKPITIFTPEKPFVFDGQGHTIYNFEYTGNSGTPAFFGHTTGTIKNINFENAYVKGNAYTAIVASKHYGNIENVHVKNSKVEDGYWQAGAISAQYNSGNLINCTATNVSIKSNGATGGLIGILNETAGVRKLKNCHVYNSTINNTGKYGEGYTGGGLIGMISIENSTVEITNCTADIVKEGEFVADLYGTVEDSTIVVIK